MLTAKRFGFVACCLFAVTAAACNGRASGPTGPTGSSGATITGVVNGGRLAALSAPAASGLTAAAAPSGMTVTVLGTNISAVVDVLGAFELAGVPGGTVRLEFRDGGTTATLQLSDVGDQDLVQIQVTVTGSNAAILEEVRTTGKVTLCHTTGNGSYHAIEVSASAEPAHRAHGDGKVGDPVPADTTKVFDASCQPVTLGVRIKKSTNGEDADSAPGPRLEVGSTVTWTYVVTNTGQVGLTEVVVTDDRGVAVSCPATSVAVGGSMTCTGSGVATAGQYRNVGMVTAKSTAGTVTHSDASHYFGELPATADDGPKVKLCHRTGNGSYHLIEVGISAEPAHRAHGDAKIGEDVPNQAGKRFGDGCAVVSR